MNIYKTVLKNNLKKLLSLYNADRNSATFGYGDRDYWGWKIKDFNNATLQGGVHSLSIALKLGLFSREEKLYVLNTIDAAIMAVNSIRDKNGSVVEAYPHENSFCVTALVAFDILSCIMNIDSLVSNNEKSKYLDTVKPLIDFINKYDENHAVISNHLATGAAAIALWNEVSGDKNERYEELLEIIYANQSDEGWYREYEGADPGYQTLCTYYLSAIYNITGESRLYDSLKKSAVFLEKFIHPDGTIGGLYGSRNTEVCYPGGIVALSSKIEEFALLAKYLEPGSQSIFPENIDMGNFVPLLNSYAVAAIIYESNNQRITKCRLNPFFSLCKSINFKDAGLFLLSTRNYFAIVNYKKGGVIKVFNKSTGLLEIEDGGLFGILENGKKFSTQIYNYSVDFSNNTIESDFYLLNESYPNSVTTIILRILSITLFKSVFLGDLFKKAIVKMMMTGKTQIDGKAKRNFKFLQDKIIVVEKIVKPKKCVMIKRMGKSKSIHMASSGYFHKQDYHNKTSRLIEFIND